MHLSLLLRRLSGPHHHGGVSAPCRHQLASILSPAYVGHVRAVARVLLELGKLALKKARKGTSRTLVTVQVCARNEECRQKRRKHNGRGFLAQNVIAERSMPTAYLGRIPCKETQTQWRRLPGAKCHRRKVHEDNQPGQGTWQRDANTVAEVLSLQKGSC